MHSIMRACGSGDTLFSAGEPANPDV